MALAAKPTTSIQRFQVISNVDQLSHAKQWLIFPKNLGKRLSIDETSFSNGVALS
jgi:hypothetical protein